MNDIDMRLAPEGDHPTLAASTPGIKVDKGIPMPAAKRDGRAGRYGRHRSYPWAAMEIGDSFAIPIEEDSIRAQTRMNGVVSDRQKRHPERYATRVVEERRHQVVRVWRTA